MSGVQKQRCFSVLSAGDLRSVEHVGFVCVDRSGTMDLGEDGALSLTHAEQMKSNKFVFARQHKVL